MQRVLTYLKSKKNWGYLLLSIVLLFLCVSSVRMTAKEVPSDRAAIEKEAFAAYASVGYTATQAPDGTVLYLLQDKDTAAVFLPIACDKNTVMTLHYTPNVNLDLDTVKLYYETADETFTKEKNVVPLPTAQGQLSFLMEDCTSLALHVETDFAPTAITFATIAPAYTVSVVPAVVLLLLVTALFAFDAKIGYVTYLKTGVKQMLASLKAELAEKKYAVAILHIAMWATTAAFAITLLTFVTVSLYSKTTIFVAFFLSLAATLFQLLYRTVSGNGKSAWAVFLAVCLLIGLMFAYAMPATMLLSYDDETHYHRAQVISHTLLFHESTYADIGQYWRFYESYDAVEDIELIHLKLTYLDSVPFAVERQSFNPLSRVCYVHQSLIITASDLCNADFLTQMTVMKMANVCIYAFVIALGLKKLKSGGYLLSAIALLPTCVFLAASMNYDYWISAWIFYAFCVFLSELQQPQKPISDYIMWQMLIAMTLGCLPKAIYFFLAVPFLFLPKSKFRDDRHRKKYRLLTFGMMALLLLSFLLPFVFNIEGQTDARGGSDVNAAGQAKFILSHPLQYAYILLKFLASYLSLDFALAMSTSYAYLGALPAVFGTVSLTLIAFCTFSDKHECDNFENVKTWKPITLLTCLLQVILCATSLYVAFTPVANKTILGVQWRYLVPILFPALYCLGSCRVTGKIKEKTMTAVVFSVLAFLLFASFAQVYLAKL